MTATGLYSREVIATFLGKKVAEIERMIREDGLPAIPIPSSAGERHKFSASQLTVWLNKRAKGARWTVEEVIAELERCQAQPGQDFGLQLATLTEIKGLCDAAEQVMRTGQTCPRLIGAISRAVNELQTSHAA